MNRDYGKNTGEETRKTWEQKLDNGFFQKYMSGKGIDIGYAGYLDNVHPVLPTAEGIDLSTPDYDGKHLPFLNNTLDYVYSSHFLEHVVDAEFALQEQFRVVKSKGHIVIVVPHRDLYEKRMELPSQFNGDHKRFFTPASLLKLVEDSLPHNSFRVRHLRDNDEGHDYNDAPHVHGRWLYEIELVLEKL